MLDDIDDTILPKGRLQYRPNVNIPRRTVGPTHTGVTSLDRQVADRLNRVWQNQGLEFYCDLGDPFNPYQAAIRKDDSRHPYPHVVIRGPLLALMGHHGETTLAFGHGMLHGNESFGGASPNNDIDTVVETINKEVYRHLVNTLPVPTAVTQMVNDTAIDLRALQDRVALLEERLAALEGGS